jgi:hypothetical protein
LKFIELSPNMPNIKKSRGTSLYHRASPPMLVKKTKKIPIKKEKAVTNTMITSSMSSMYTKTLFKNNLFNKSLFLNL